MNKIQIFIATITMSFIFFSHYTYTPLSLVYQKVGQTRNESL